MAHNLEIYGGKGSFFTNGEAAWHKLGDVVHSAPPAKEAIQVSRANFDLVLEDVQDMNGVSIPNFKAIIRQDTRVTFGMVKPSFGVVQPESGFDWAEKVLGEAGAHFETAGVLGQG